MLLNRIQSLRNHHSSSCLMTCYSLLIVAIFLLISISEARDCYSCTKYDWFKYKKAYGKHYANKSEDSMRKQIFCTNLVHIQKHNAKSSKNGGFLLGLNHMSDWNEAEINNILGYDYQQELQSIGQTANNLTNRIRSSVGKSMHMSTEDHTTNEVNIPNQLDWRNHSGRVGSVYNQGECGACWAFVTVGLIEGQQVKTATRGDNGSDSNFKLVPLSAQNLIDCDKREGGCVGGVAYRALYYIQEAGGLQTERDYPFVSYKTGTAGECRFNKALVHTSTTSIKGPKFLKTNDEEYLKNVLATYGPIAVSMESSWSFFQYRSGIFIEKGPRTGRLNHAVLLIGYGTTSSGEDYWLVKNSWGVEWGEAGFGKIARNRGNHCGIEEMPIIFK